MQARKVARAQVGMRAKPHHRLSLFESLRRHSEAPRSLLAGRGTSLSTMFCGLGDSSLRLKSGSTQDGPGTRTSVTGEAYRFTI